MSLFIIELGLPFEGCPLIKSALSWLSVCLWPVCPNGERAAERENIKSKLAVLGECIWPGDTSGARGPPPSGGAHS
jgi:hypothetical protein